MARLPLVDPGEEGADPATADALEQAGRSMNPHVFRAMANHPEALEGFLVFGNAVYFQNSISPAQRELAYLTASVVNQCHYWIPMHVLLGRAAGLTEEKLAHLGDNPLPEGVYSPDEAAIVAYAQRSTRMEPIDDATYGALSAHFERRQLMDICFTVGLSNMVNRFHATFLTDIDPWMPQALGDSCPLGYPSVPGGGDQ